MVDAQIAKVAAEFESIEKKVGLDLGFFGRLIDEKDDWAFVVKVNVVLEASLNAVLAEISPGHDLTGFVGQLALQGRSGKLAMARAAGVIGGEYAEAFSALATIRNKFVHSLSGLSGTLASYATTLSDQQRLDFARNAFVIDEAGVEAFRKESVDQFAADFRNRIWWCAACVLMAICTGDSKNEFRKLRFQMGEIKPLTPPTFNL
jgi:hypothetical protein